MKKLVTICCMALMIVMGSVCSSIAGVVEFTDEASFISGTGSPQYFIDFESDGDGNPFDPCDVPIVGDEWLNLGIQFAELESGFENSLILSAKAGMNVSPTGAPGHALATAGLSPGNDRSSRLITFSTPVISFGVYIVDNETTSPTERIILKDENGNVIGDFPMPGGAGPAPPLPIAHDFRGYSSTIPIAEVHIIEANDNEGSFLDNVMYSVPEPPCEGEGWIAFTSNRDGDPDIWAVRADGTDLKQLTNLPGTQHYLQWSPDSTKIAYSSESEAQLWVYDWLTGTNTKVYDGHDYEGQDLGSYGAYMPAWSPDGTKILFREDASYNNPHITVINADGTGRAIVPIQSGHVSSPSWSQSGTAFAYDRRNSGLSYTHDLWIYDFTATGDIMNGINHRLTEGASGESTTKFDSDWAPSGDILFAWGHNLAVIDSGESGNWGDPSNPNVTFLTDDASYPSLRYGGPSWSTNLSQIVYWYQSGGQTDLWVLDVSNPDTRYQLIDNGSSPDWGNPPSEPACWVEEDKLLASDGAAGDDFGYSVGISGNTAIVGALGDDDAGSRSGSAYLFDLSDPSNPIQTYKLNAGNADADDLFGCSVALSGSTALVGASDSDDAGSLSGSAYLFDVATGTQIAKLTASDAAAGDEFGFAVAISGELVIVGVHYDDDACPSDPSCNSGSAYLYDFSDPCNIIEIKLTASDSAAGDSFGYSVALSGTTAIVGAYGNDDACPADHHCNSGSAYLFDVATGSQIAKLTASDAAAGDHFGISVAISGSTALVGAHHDDDAGSNSGSAYLYDFSDPCNIIETKLTASDAAGGDKFGVSVALSGSTALVGAYQDEVKGTGSAYLFDVATGTQIAKLTASDAAAGDFFGRSVALSSATAIVGAYGNDDAGSNSGSAYVFENLCDLEPIAEMLDFIEGSVSDETLAPVKAGKPGQGQLGALINMIEAAGNLIEAGLPVDACIQLHDSFEKTDGLSPPESAPDFVTGEAAAELANMIEDLMAELGC